MVKAQAGAGLRVSLLATFREGAKPEVQAMLDEGVEVELIGPASGPLQRHPSLWEKVQEHVAQSDVVHIHTVWEEIQHLAAREASRRSIPYVVTPHGMLTSWSLHQKWLKKRIYLAWRLRGMLDRATAIHYTTE